MKTSVLSVAIAALAGVSLATTAAEAKTKYSKRHYGQARAQAFPSGGLGSGTNRFAPVQNYGGIEGNGPIYRDGRYLGQDPDPNIRFEIIRDKDRFRR